MKDGTIFIIIFAVAVVAVVAIVGLVASTKPEESECKSSNEAVEKTLKEKERLRAEEEASKKEQEEKERLEKEKKDAEEKKRKKKEEKEAKKWASDGPDFESEYKVGDMVYHIGTPCMVVGRHNRRVSWGCSDWGIYLSIYSSTPLPRKWIKESASMWVQFGDQMQRHKLSEEDVKLKITK